MLVSTLVAHAQAPGLHNPRRDSVEAALARQPRPDTGRLFTLNEVIWENRDSNPARSLALAAEALVLGQRLHSKRGLAKTYVLRGIVYATSGRLSEAIADFEACRRLRAELGDWQGVAGAINNIAETQAQQGHYEAAVRNYIRALRLEERYGNPDRIAADLANLGQVYLQMGRSREALAYQLRYLRLPGRHFDASIDAGARNGVGEAFARLGQPDSARTYFRQALTLSRSNDDRRDEALALAGLGALEARAGHPGPATRYLTQALAMQQQLGDESAQTTTLLSLAGLEANPHPAVALARYQQALALARRSHVRENQRAARAGLAVMAARLGRFAEAYEQASQVGALRDSLLDETSIHQIVEMQAKYETEKKEVRNQLQASQLRTQQQIIRRRNVQLGAGLVVAGLLAGLAYLLYNRRRLRREVEFAQERQQLTQQRTSAVLAAEETERQRIGADLHDGVGQLLTVARLNLEALGEALPLVEAGSQELLANALSVVDESFREVRSISHNLLPNALLKRGLVLAVRDFLSKVSPGGRLKINLEVVGLDAGPRLPATVENVLFRVIQELVQNILKHAQATELTLQLIRHPGELTILMEDNGVGFDPAALGADAGIGLKNIESRMAYLGGRAEFDSAPGRGTTVTLEVPIGPLTE